MATSTSRPATPPLSRTASFSAIQQQYPPDSKYSGQPDVEQREGLLEAREEGAADARLQKVNKPAQGNSSGGEYRHLVAVHRVLSRFRSSRHPVVLRSVNHDDRRQQG